MTLRIEDELRDAIEMLARRERVSVNFTANRALKRYVEWDTAENSRGYVSVPSGLVAKMMDSITQEEARQLGRWAATTIFVPNMKRRFSNISLQALLVELKTFSKYTGRFSFDHSENAGKHVVLIRQQMGRNWSSFYAGGMETIFRNLLRKKVKVKEGPQISTFEFED